MTIIIEHAQLSHTKYRSIEQIFYLFDNLKKPPLDNQLRDELATSAPQERHKLVTSKNI